MYSKINQWINLEDNSPFNAIQLMYKHRIIGTGNFQTSLFGKQGWYPYKIIIEASDEMFKYDIVVYSYYTTDSGEISFNNRKLKFKDLVFKDVEDTIKMKIESLYQYILLENTIKKKTESLSQNALLENNFKNENGKTSLEFGDYIGSLYKDGSGVFGRPDDVVNFNDTWSFRIKHDEMTDDLIITARRYPYTGKIQLNADIFLWLDLSNKKQEYLCVAGHDFPGKKAMIRIDKNDTISTDKEGWIPITPELNEQLKKGSEITIRGYHWPYESAQTHTISLDGYMELTNFLRSKR